MLGVLATGNCTLAWLHATEHFSKKDNPAGAHPSQVYTHGLQAIIELEVHTAHPAAILEGQQEEQRQSD
jgi:hypothetical protein